MLEDTIGVIFQGFKVLKLFCYYRITTKSKINIVSNIVEDDISKLSPPPNISYHGNGTVETALTFMSGTHRFGPATLCVYDWASISSLTE